MSKSMISRRYLRIKVMQALYARQANPDTQLYMGEKQLEDSIRQCEVLSVYFYSIFPEIKHYIETKQEDRKNKIFPTEEDLNPNTRFVENRVIRQMETCDQLNHYWRSLKVNWVENKELIVNLFNQIEALPEYQVYMTAPDTNYKADKELILTILEKVFAESELLHWYFEEKFVHWFDDYNDALLQVYQVINFWKASQEQVKMSPLYKDETEDVLFYKNLYKLTIKNDAEYQKMIEANLKNWESDRIIETDMILMKMAVCELMEFPSIPTKVTINEYIDIARTYGSEKSGLFINGLVDKIARELREEGRLNKQGRGLLDRSLN